MVLMKRDGGGDVSEMTPLVNSMQQEGHIWTDPQPPHQRCLCEALNVTDSVYLCI